MAQDDAPDDRAPSTARLTDGREVLVRFLDAGDMPTLQSGLHRLSADSRYQRFMSAMPALSETQARYFADVDGVDHVAFGVSDPSSEVDGNPEGLGVATARYVRTQRESSTAEIAITVVDDYQRLGLGSILLDHLIEHARHNGVRRLTATMLTQNRGVRALLAGRRFVVGPTAEASVVEARLDLAPHPPPD
jgi:GNAT superfamily N-acetyltransferase